MREQLQLNNNRKAGFKKCSSYIYRKWIWNSGYLLASPLQISCRHLRRDLFEKSSVVQEEISIRKGRPLSEGRSKSERYVNRQKWEFFSEIIRRLMMGLSSGYFVCSRGDIYKILIKRDIPIVLRMRSVEKGHCCRRWLAEIFDHFGTQCHVTRPQFVSPVPSLLAILLDVFPVCCSFSRVFIIPCLLVVSSVFLVLFLVYLQGS